MTDKTASVYCWFVAWFTEFTAVLFYSRRYKDTSETVKHSEKYYPIKNWVFFYWKRHILIHSGALFSS